jgi:selenide,water dikinase
MISTLPALGRDPAILVGIETGDDAGVYQVSADQALVLTADYITPLIDDPDRFGQIAAANSLSDIYAMGGRPVAALNLCVFPQALDAAVAREILAGSERKVAEAGAAIVGGHTVCGPELLYGLSVTGLVHPQRVVRNVGARAGDVLLLTKPLGTGLLVTGYRRGLVTQEDMAEAIRGMMTLNKTASEVLSRFPVHAMTDVTGFGLLGHTLGMARAGGTFVLDLGRLPLYPHALDLAGQGLTCAGARANRRAYAGRWTSTGPLTAAQEELLHDPQTSGGLIAALPGAAAAAAQQALAEAGVSAVIIGEVEPGPGGVKARA